MPLMCTQHPEYWVLLLLVLWGAPGGPPSPLQQERQQRVAWVEMTFPKGPPVLVQGPLMPQQQGAPLW